MLFPLGILSHQNWEWFTWNLPSLKLTYSSPWKQASPIGKYYFNHPFVGANMLVSGNPNTLRFVSVMKDTPCSSAENTVHGSEILHQLIRTVSKYPIINIHVQGFIHPWWCINNMTVDTNLEDHSCGHLRQADHRFTYHTYLDLQVGVPIQP